jgi:hypothetical protein
MTMFEIYKIPSDEQRSPKKCIGHFTTPEQAMTKLNFNRTEMENALNGKVVKGKYVLEFDSNFMRELAIDSLIETHIDRLNCREIAQELEIDVKTVTKYLSDALRTLKKNSKDKEFAQSVCKLKEIQRRKIGSVLNGLDLCHNNIIEQSECYMLDGFDIKVNTKAKVTIED